MFCSKCGCKNNDGAAFCNSCGSQLSAPTNEKSTIKADVELLPTKTRKGANTCLTGSIIGAIVCLFIFVIFKPIVSSPAIPKAYLIILIWVAVCSLFMLRKKSPLALILLSLACLLLSIPNLLLPILIGVSFADGQAAGIFLAAPLLSIETIMVLIGSIKALSGSISYKNDIKKQ